MLLIMQCNDQRYHNEHRLFLMFLFQIDHQSKLLLYEKQSLVSKIKNCKRQTYILQNTFELNVNGFSNVNS